MNNLSSIKTLESMGQAAWYNQWTVNKFEKHLRRDILEVGCGIGNFTKFLTKYGKVWAVDINIESLRITKELVNKTAEVGFGDIEKGEFFFDKKKFDTIVCLNVIEHVNKDLEAFKNLHKLLKPDGTLILIVPSHQFLYGQIDKSIGHFRRYSKNKLNNNLKNLGFNIIKSRRLNFLGAIGWFVAGKILKEEEVGQGKIGIFNFLAPIILPIEDIVKPPIGTSLLLIVKKK